MARLRGFRMAGPPDKKKPAPAPERRELPRPHGEKLRALLNNRKLPQADKQRVEEAVKRYNAWRAALDEAKGEGDALLRAFVDATNAYKRFIEFDLIFNSEDDFLYRQKGQLKLDNTILEEFLPRLVDPRLVPGIQKIGEVVSGPQRCFSGFYIGPLAAPLAEGGIFIKSKNQDFAVGRKLYVKASKRADFANGDVLNTSLNVAYFAAELKTNLDKTMFQEAEATARELKQAVLGAVYILLCEWLDMPPIDTRLTSIDEVIILRKAKRLGSGVREQFDTAANRKRLRREFEKHLNVHPLAFESFARLVHKLKNAFPDAAPAEEVVLERGFF